MRVLSAKGCLFLWQLIVIKSTSSVRITPLLVPHEREANLQPITWNCVKRVEASKKWKFLQSKGYPKLLNVKESRCSWKIVTAKGSRVKLAFRGMDLYADDPAHCSANYVEIIDETLKKSQARFCGKALPGDIVSHGNKIRVDFQAQSGIDTSTKGFSIAFARTNDQSGFYQRQSFGKRPTPKPTKAPRRPSPIVIIDTDSAKDKQSSGGRSTSIEAIIGVIIAIVAVAIIGFIVWKKRKQVQSFLKESDKKTTSSSLDAYPAPPQNKVDPFERIMKVIEPYPPPPSEKSEDNRSTYVNCQAPPLPHKNRILPEAKIKNFSMQDDDVLLGSSSRNYNTACSVESSHLTQPPRYTSSSNHINQAIARTPSSVRSLDNSILSQPLFRSHGTRSRDNSRVNASVPRINNSGRASTVSTIRLPPIPPRDSQSYSQNFVTGSSQQPLSKKREANPDVHRNLSLINDPVMEEERMRRLESRASSATWASSKAPLHKAHSNQYSPRNKFYLPEKPLPDIPSGGSPEPPPLPPKTRSILLSHDEEPSKPWLHRAPSRCLSRCESRSMSDLLESDVFPQTRFRDVGGSSCIRPRRRSISDFTEVSRQADVEKPSLPSRYFDRNNRMRATVGSRVPEPRKSAREPPLPPRDDLGLNSISKDSRRSMRAQRAQDDFRFEPRLPSRSTSTFSYKERHLPSVR